VIQNQVSEVREQKVYGPTIIDRRFS